MFGIGFLLGTMRTLFIAPRLGARTAELMEAPIMIAVSFVAARGIVRRMALPLALLQRIAMGAIALTLLLAAEFGLLLPLRGLSLREYFATLDPVSGPVYYLALLLFTIAPSAVERRPTLEPSARINGSIN